LDGYNTPSHSLIETATSVHQARFCQHRSCTEHERALARNAQIEAGFQSILKTGVVFNGESLHEKFIQLFLSFLKNNQL
jgi:hypothetical protein